MDDKDIISLSQEERVLVKIKDVLSPQRISDV